MSKFAVLALLGATASAATLSAFASAEASAEWNNSNIAISFANDNSNGNCGSGSNNDSTSGTSGSGTTTTSTVGTIVEQGGEADSANKISCPNAAIQIFTEMGSIKKQVLPQFEVLLAEA